ncbi:cell division protein FtsQ/DivIB [Thiomicrorhabdus immobilis]|nr:cell division protein FtsQ/DivIB [Thiomicrorhabdus immobilis]
MQIFVLILAIALLALVAWSSTQKNSPFYQPIQAYELTTPLSQVTPQEIEETVKPYLGKSFWDIPLNHIQADLIRLDWVQSAEVKRKWPNLLYLSIKEQVPVARWGDSGLVNRSGRVFFPLSIAGFENLVRLDGDLSESEWVLRNLIDLQNQLNALNMTVSQLKLSEDKVWQVQILNGPSLVIDSLEYQHKLQRFIQAFPQLDSAMRKSARVYDLRYSNGFIIAKNQS